MLLHHETGARAQALVIVRVSTEVAIDPRAHIVEPVVEESECILLLLLQLLLCLLLCLLLVMNLLVLEILSVFFVLLSEGLLGFNQIVLMLLV